MDQKFIIERVIIDLVCSCKCPVNSFTDVSYNGGLWGKCYLGCNTASDHWKNWLCPVIIHPCPLLIVSTIMLRYSSSLRGFAPCNEFRGINTGQNERLEMRQVKDP